ncbi:MAG: AAA family ATPase [Bacteroidales bacterium]
MLPNGLVEELLNLDRIAKEAGRKLPRKRFLYHDLYSMVTGSRQFIGIAGLRGAGKTILLRQLAAELEHSFYFSADTLPSGTDLFGLATLLTDSFGVKYLMIDEIHALNGWQGQLKKMYDFQAIYTYETDFREYSRIGALPASLESHLQSVIVSIIDKVIQKDMMTIGKLSQEDVMNIRSEG